MITRVIIALFFIVSLQANQVESDDNTQKLQVIEEKLKEIDNSLGKNIWLTRYSNYMTYQDLTKEMENTNAQLKRYRKRRDKLSRQKYEELKKKKQTLQKQIEFLKDFKESPFAKVIKPDEIPPAPKISSPLSIIPAFSYIKQLEQEKRDYEQSFQSLGEIIEKLKEKEQLLKDIYEINKDESFKNKIEELKSEIEEFESAYDISKTTITIYSKKVEEATLSVTEDIKEQIKRAINIAFIILIVIAISLLTKMVVKKYITDDERFYMANKIINFGNITLILLIILFAYIENVTYLVTVLGFASAGIAIAMKDLFMSILGWLVIIFGGSFHVGDRVKVRKEGLSYVGDIVDISLLRMTILEDITLTSYRENIRSGRIVFIPNNYIFTELISNYTHNGIKTVWDNINITITFKSNHKKALHLAKEVTRKYSKGYTEIARKQLNKLRSRYSFKISNVEPRIYSFTEHYGIVISCWYMTNSYATLTLRSTISTEIIDLFKKADDIEIAYPTQTIIRVDGEMKSFLPDEDDG